VAQQDYRRLVSLSQREQSPEVGICGHEHTLLLECRVKDERICGALEAEGPHVHSVMSGGRK
jgi:hypothetical protein